MTWTLVCEDHPSRCPVCGMITEHELWLYKSQAVEVWELRCKRCRVHRIDQAEG